VLELRSVSARYGQVQVLWDVSLTVGEGELVCLLGGNASGKSTTIASCCTTQRRTSSTIP